MAEFEGWTRTLTSEIKRLSSGSSSGPASAAVLHEAIEADEARRHAFNAESFSFDDDNNSQAQPGTSVTPNSQCTIHKYLLYENSVILLLI